MRPPLHIGLAAPVATRDIAALLSERAPTLPRGYEGAPMLVSLVSGLLSLGHRVSVFTLSSDLPLTPGAAVRARGERLSVHYLPMRPRAWPFNSRRVGRIVDLYAFERKGLVGAMQQARPDVIHAHWAYEFAWAGLASGLPHVITCHDAPSRVARFYRDPRHVAYRWLRAGMAWHVLRHARHVTAVSPYMAQAIAPLCRVPVDVVPNPVPPQAFEIERQLRPDRARVLLVCNGFSRHKNATAALRAFALLRRHVPHAELVACGSDFGIGEAAHRWCKAQGLQHGVHFAGAQTQAQVLDWMAHADLLLHPSLEESFGMVVAEAMALGLAVVAGERSGAVPWVLSGCGALVDVTQPDSMAQAAATLLLAQRSAQRLGEQARDQARTRFSYQQVAAAYEACYRRALGDLLPYAHLARATDA